MTAFTSRAVVIGGGPAGLMAAETIAATGISVTVVDRMPSVGRKLLMAGRGGLNLTHATALPGFLDSYAEAAPALRAAIEAFPPEAAVAWCEGLGQPCFTGSSGRIFPTAMKASPLLRAWLARLVSLGVRFETRRRWVGWTDTGDLRFEDGETAAPEALILALGGGTWPRLGSDGAWTGALAQVGVRALRPANCGFIVEWPEQVRARFAGTPLKRIALRFAGASVRGEALVTDAGIEGGAVYALSAQLRDAIDASGPAEVLLDLRPDLTEATLVGRLDVPRRGQSLSNFLRKQAGLPPVAVALVQMALHSGATEALPALIKGLKLRLVAPMPMARAISTAGGIRLGAIDPSFMLVAKPGVFVAGEMLDWEAPTGGFLLQACLSTGRAAGAGAVDWLRGRDRN